MFILAFVLVFLLEGSIHFFHIIKGSLVELAISENGTGFKVELLKFSGMVLIIPATFYLYSKVFLRISAYSLRNLRLSIFYSIVKRPFSQYIQHNEGRYINAYTNQISAIETSFFQCVFGFLQIVSTSVLGLFLIYSIYPPLVIVSIFGIILAVLLPELLRKVIVKLEKKAILANEANLSLLNEFLNGIETILNFEKEMSFISRFRQSTKDYNRTRKKWSLAMSGGFHISQLILNVYSVASLLIVAKVISNGTLSIGEYIAVLGILFNFTNNLPYTSIYLQQFKAARENLNYINETIAYKEQSLPKDTVNLDTVEEIRFKNISFSYPESDKLLLNQFSLLINGKGIIQIQGESGKGKSTLVSLLCRYYPVNEGNIYLSDVPIDKIGNLNELITIMRQETIFFDGSLAENLSMFSSISDEDLINSLKNLGLDNLAKPETLHAPFSNYSGGEARRLMVLRALLRKSEIIILDEPLANLDPESIQCLEKYLLGKNDCFILLITHQDLSIPTKQTVRI